MMTNLKSKKSNLFISHFSQNVSLYIITFIQYSCMSNRKVYVQFSGMKDWSFSVMTSGEDMKNQDNQQTAEAKFFFWGPDGSINIIFSVIKPQHVHGPQEGNSFRRIRAPQRSGYRSWLNVLIFYTFTKWTLYSGPLLDARVLFLESTCITIFASNEIMLSLGSTELGLLTRVNLTHTLCVRERRKSAW